MPRPNIVTPPKGIPGTEGVAVYRLDIAFNTPGIIIPSGVGIAGSPGIVAGTYNYRLGRLPVGAEVIFAKARAVTVFNGAGATTLSLGTDTTAYVNILPATTIKAAAAFNTVAAAGLIIDTTVENDIIAQIVEAAGAAATAGLVRIVLGISAPVGS